MEIIKDTTKEENKYSKEVTCPYCQSILRVDEEDYCSGYGYLINEKGQSVRNYTDHIIVCPCYGSSFVAL